MNKVIRSARFSDHPVILPIHLGPDRMSLPFEGEDQDDGVDKAEAAQVQDVDASETFTSLADRAEVVGEGDEVGLEEALAPEPGLLMAEVDALIAERLQEAEARFLQEKEQEKEAAYTEGCQAGSIEGYDKGYVEGLAEGQAQSQDEIARFQAILSAVAERWDDVFKMADVNLTQLAFEIARNIMDAVVEVKEDVVLDAVRDCLAHLQDKSRLIIHINPDDLEIARAHRSRWQATYERIASITIEADEEIERGGCVIETPSGDIDAQISSRLEKLRIAIFESIQGTPKEMLPDIVPDADVVDEIRSESETGELEMSDDVAQDDASQDESDMT